MTVTSALLRAGALALAVTTAGSGARGADYFSARDGNQALLYLWGHKLSTISGNPYFLPGTSLATSDGTDIGLHNPLPVAPGIAAATPIDRGGPITTAGTAQTIMGASTARKGGWITADPNNSGTVFVSYTGTANTTGGAGTQCPLPPGNTCPLTVNGYVIQTAISIAGTVAGDKVEAVEFQ